MVRASGPCQLGLLLRTNRGEHLGADQLGDLDQHETRATGAGVDQDLLARRQLVRVLHEVVGGHPLQWDGGSNLERHVARHLHRAPGRHHRPLGVRARRARPRDTVADHASRHVDADLDHRARALEPECVRERHLVQPGPVVRVDVVEPGRRDLDK
jgi:hypothetical protein